MLQNDTGFARIFQDFRIAGWDLIEKGLDGGKRRYLICRVDDCEQGGKYVQGADKPPLGHQGAVAEPVFAIEPFDHLMYELPRKRHFIESPTLDPGMNVHCMLV